MNQRIADLTDQSTIDEPMVYRFKVRETDLATGDTQTVEVEVSRPNPKLAAIRARAELDRLEDQDPREGALVEVNSHRFSTGRYEYQMGAWF